MWYTLSRQETNNQQGVKAMAEKKLKRGTVSTQTIRDRIGAEGIKQAEKLQSEYSDDVIIYASRTLNPIPAKVRAILAALPAATRAAAMSEARKQYARTKSAKELLILM
ncbi:hypothetical protein LCGC14_0629860 [marine sediment metagenome]|uniref:Uncharacterized protein n=1 Tax=marine sediment metagenome TaxID=412755 RepID=A0A0F9R7G9_9ZZZZ